MKQSPPDALYAYWTALRGHALAPRRFDIEPSRIAPLLPHTFILEKLGPRDYRYRIAGTAICELFGLEMRDHSFFEGWDQADRLVLERTLAVVTRRGGVARFELDANSGPHPDVARTASRHRPSHTPVRLRGVLLPLLHTEGRIDRVLGALAVEETVANSHEWGGREPLSTWRLAALDTDWPRNPPSTSDRNDETPAATDRDAIQADLLTGGLARLAPGNGEGGGEVRDRQAPFLPHIRKARIVRSDRRQFRVYDGGLNTPEPEAAARPETPAD